MSKKPNFLVVVPVYNGGAVWVEAADRIQAECQSKARVLVIDSGSKDGSERIAKEKGFELICIPNEEFEHSGTRQKALDFLKGEDYLVYLTQDSVLRAGAIDALLSSFDDDEVAVAYGRQLPRQKAGPIEAHARYFNYPSTPYKRSCADIPKYGLKTAFCSNSFAAYRVRDLKYIGGFPIGVNFAEDMYVVAKLLLAGKKVAYASGANCIHSHDYTLVEDYRRAIEIGLFHGENPWILKEFGSASGEGRRFVMSEIFYVARANLLLVPSVILRTIAKYIGYRVGLNRSVAKMAPHSEFR